jgi:hypothetical protein
MGSSSLFSMLHEEAPPPRPLAGAAAGSLELTNGRKEKKANKEHKDKKEKKEKKSKKDKQVRLAWRHLAFLSCQSAAGRWTGC